MARTKSVLSQMNEVLDQMAEVSKEDKPDKVKVSLLTSRLDTLRYLHQQEVAADQNALAVENEKLKRELAELKTLKESQPSDNALLDAQVAAMMARHNWGVAENKSVIQTPVPVPTPPPLSRDESTAHIATPPPRLVEDDFIT